jgi:hypothetical protein
VLSAAAGAAAVLQQISGCSSQPPHAALQAPQPLPYVPPQQKLHREKYSK